MNTVKTTKDRKQYWPLTNFRMPPKETAALKANAERRMIGVSALIRNTLYDAGLTIAQDVREHKKEAIREEHV